jgi:hypothetical protein
MKLTLKGHRTHRTYGRFHSNAMPTTYAQMTPIVTPCVWFTLRPRRSKWCEARAGAVVTKARRASLASEEGGIAGAMFTIKGQQESVNESTKVVEMREYLMLDVCRDSRKLGTCWQMTRYRERLRLRHANFSAENCGCASAECHEDASTSPPTPRTYSYKLAHIP